MSSPSVIPDNIVQMLDRAAVQQQNSTSNHAGDFTFMSSNGNSNPFAVSANTRELAAYSGDYYGAFSIEDFPTIGDLSFTHDDASGWLAYVEQFQPRNFWYGDTNVKPWAYYEEYDNWQDTYGIDAVMAAYHSGHGGMSANGVFHLPMGGDWGGLGTTVFSDRMRLGNEQLRYIFLSTCESLRVLGGHSPIRTWAPANLGFRMIFGFETVSVDHPAYGSAFWKHWNQNKSFSTAWMDASWYDISRNQAPSVAACGATQQEATDRVHHERLFYGQNVSTAWWAWRWYYAAGMQRQVKLMLPQERLAAQFAPRLMNSQYINQVLNKFGLRDTMPRAAVMNNYGGVLLEADGMSVSFQNDGAYDISLVQPDLETTDQISDRQAVRIAQEFVRQFKLDTDNLVLDRVVYAYDASGTNAGTGRIETPRITETIVLFTQLINGQPVISPGDGGLSVRVDNAGRVTGVRNTTRRVVKLTDMLVREPLVTSESLVSDTVDTDELISLALQKHLRTYLLKGTMPRAWTTVPGSYEVGYAIRHNQAVLVVRSEVEFEFSGGYRKRYIIEAPITEQ